MKITEFKPITVNKDVVTGIQCDVCGIKHDGTSLPNDWHSFSEHHSDWGNDSCDSYEYYDVCSPKCYVLKLAECINHLEGRERTGIVDDMKLNFAKRMIHFIKQ